MIVYDVETERLADEVDGGWENPFGMGLSCATVYDVPADRFEMFFGPQDRLQLAQRLSGQAVVTFNGVRFDSKVVLGNNRKAVIGRPLTKRGAVHMRSISLPGKAYSWEEVDVLMMALQAKFGTPDMAEAESLVGRSAVHDGSLTLASLAKGTLGTNEEKIGTGSKAVRWYAEKQYARLFQYNLHDVRLTWKLFEFARKHGYLIDGNGAVLGL